MLSIFTMDITAAVETVDDVATSDGDDGDDDDGGNDVCISSDFDGDVMSMYAIGICW